MVKQSRVDEVAERVSASLASPLGLEIEIRRLALTAVFLAAASAWLALAWAEPYMLIGVPASAMLFVGGRHWLARRMKEEGAYEAPTSDESDVDEARLRSAVRLAQAAGVSVSPPTRRGARPTPLEPPAKQQKVEPLETEDIVYEVRDATGLGRPLFTSSRFIDAADFALDFLAANEIETLDVVRVWGGGSEKVSTYAKNSGVPPQKEDSLVDLYGYPVTSWRAARSTRRGN